MNIAFMIWSGLLVLVALVWASRHLALSRNQRCEKPLSSGSSVKLPTPAPKVSMLVAAKDEEANIEACVTSMLAQDYPALEVFAVNDRSTDRTPEILEGITSKNGIPYTPLLLAGQMSACQGRWQTHGTLERVAGFEPTPRGWKPRMLPLNTIPAQNWRKVEDSNPCRFHVTGIQHPRLTRLGQPSS